MGTPSKMSQEERLRRKRESARIRQQRCRARKRQAALEEKKRREKEAEEARQGGERPPKRRRLPSPPSSQQERSHYRHLRTRPYYNKVTPSHSFEQSPQSDYPPPEYNPDFPTQRPSYWHDNRHQYSYHYHSHRQQSIYHQSHSYHHQHHHHRHYEQQHFLGRESRYDSESYEPQSADHFYRRYQPSSPVFRPRHHGPLPPPHPPQLPVTVHRPPPSTPPTLPPPPPPPTIFRRTNNLQHVRPIAQRPHSAKRASQIQQEPHHHPPKGRHCPQQQQQQQQRIEKPGPVKLSHPQEAKRSFKKKKRSGSPHPQFARRKSDHSSKHKRVSWGAASVIQEKPPPQQAASRMKDHAFRHRNEREEVEPTESPEQAAIDAILSLKSSGSSSSSSPSSSPPRSQPGTQSTWSAFRRYAKHYTPKETTNANDKEPEPRTIQLEPGGFYVQITEV